MYAHNVYGGCGCGAGGCACCLGLTRVCIAYVSVSEGIVGERVIIMWEEAFQYWVMDIGGAQLPGVSASVKYGGN